MAKNSNNLSRLLDQTDLLSYGRRRINLKDNRLRSSYLCAYTGKQWRPTSNYARSQEEGLMSAGKTLDLHPAAVWKRIEGPHFRLILLLLLPSSKAGRPKPKQFAGFESEIVSPKCNT